MYGYMDIGMSVYCKCLCIDTAGMYIMYIRMQMHARLAEVSGSFTGSPISYLVTDNLVKRVANGQTWPNQCYKVQTCY